MDKDGVFYAELTDTEGNDVWTGPLAEGNGPAIVTDPIYGHERYVCRVTDQYQIIPVCFFEFRIQRTVRTDAHCQYDGLCLDLGILFAIL